MASVEDAYARARRGDFSGMEALHAEAPEPTVTAVPANMERLIAAAKSTDWDPLYKAAMIGAGHFEGDTQREIMEAALAGGKAGSESTLEAQIAEAVTRLKVTTEAERRVASEAYAGSEELSWDDLEAAETRWIVSDFIPEEGACFLLARSNLGKTFTYIDMVCRLTQGMTFLGKATRPAKVLIVLGEGKSGFIDRLKAWALHHGKPVEALRPWLSFIDRANLNNDESLGRIAEVADREEVELVVFDTWAATSGVHKEEDNALNAATLNRVKDALPGRALLFVHHPRKAEEDTDRPVMRGAGALYGAAEVVMAMYRDRTFSPSTGEVAEYIALSTEVDHGGKNRVSTTETIRGLHLAEVELPNGEVGRVLDQVTSEAISKEAREVRKYLTRDMSAAEFAQAYPKSRATAYKHLARAVEEGVASKIAGPLDTVLYHPLDRWTGLLGAAA